MKRCVRCGAEKPVDEFYRRARSKDGRSGYCIECAKVAKKKWYAENADEAKESTRRYYAENPDKAEIKRHRQREYYRANREVLAEKQKLYTERNKEAIAERASRYRRNNIDRMLAKEAERRARSYENRALQSARWREKNPDMQKAARKRWNENNYEKVLESARICGARRRARKLAATTVDFSYDHVMARWAYYGNRCYLCKRDAEQTDHVKPLAKGGANMLCNLRPICRKCNEFKNDRWPFMDLLPSRGS